MGQALGNGIGPGAGGAAPTSHATSACPRKTVTRLRRTLPAWRKYGHQFVNYGQVVCFDFTGDGRRDVAFTMWAAMNHGAHLWAAFRRTAHGWARARYSADCCGAHRSFGMGIGIRRSGRSLLVDQPIYRRRDAACCPSGGIAAGVWEWRSGRLKLTAVHKSK
jgi:hypothetical protein